MRKNLRGGSVTRLTQALTLLGYRFSKAPHEYKRGKFHAIIMVSSNTRCSLTLHRDRSHLLHGHEAIWFGRDLEEEINKIMNKYHELRGVKE